MSSTPTGQKKRWTRVSGRKVKTGCRTCKARRLKCDEHKPGCFRCQLSGWECEGYGVNQAVETRKETQLSGSASGSTSTPPPPEPSPFPFTMETGVIGDANERRSFHHFRLCTTDDLSGCFDSHFWRTLVLRLSHTEPAVKHAIIAFSTAHERYQSNDTKDVAGPDLALQQYNKSVAYLNRQLSIPSRRNSDVALICCLLFICYESVRGNPEGSLLHFTNGAKIIKSRESSAPDDPSGPVPYIDPHIDEEDIAILFRGLDISRTAFLDTKEPELPVTMNKKLDQNFQQDTLFSDLPDARRRLGTLTNLVMHHIMTKLTNYKSPDYIDIEIHIQNFKLATILRQWVAQFDALIKRPGMMGITGRELQAVFTLIVQQKVVKIMLEASPWNEPEVIRKFQKEMDDIVAISAWLANPSTPHPSIQASETNQPSKITPTFSADLGYVAPLYYVVNNSPDVETRRKAISVLMIPRREGLWDSLLIARIAQKLIDAQITAKDGSFDGSVMDWAAHVGVLTGESPSV